MRKMFLVGAAVLTAAACAPSTPTQSYDAASSPRPPVTLAAYRPSPADYRVTLKTLSRECFGDYGCNITARPNLTLTNGQAKGRAVEISLRISGPQDGAQVQTLDVDEDGKFSSDTVIATVNPGGKLTAKITDVETQE